MERVEKLETEHGSPAVEQQIDGKPEGQIAAAEEAAAAARPRRGRTVKRRTVVLMVEAAALAALSVSFMYLNFPIIPLVPFMKMDFAEIPVLIGGFLLGPLYAVVIEAVKCLLVLFKDIAETFGVGALSNLICSLAFVLPPALIYRRRKTLKRAVFGLGVGVVAEVVVSAVSNYFFIFPLYEKLMGLERVLGDMTRPGILIAAVVPFNLIKTVASAAVTISVYKPLSKFFKRMQRA